MVLYRKYEPKLQSLSAEQRAAAASGRGLHARGPNSAPVTIEEFGDFQCPPCGVISEPLNQLQKDFSKQVKLVFRQHPLTTTHRFAGLAAAASEAAGLQGRFWAMHDLLYREQVAWSKAQEARPLFLSYAKMLGLDSARFRKDMDGPVVKARIAADERRGQELGVTLTPTILVNGKPVNGPALNPLGLRRAVEEAVAENPPH